MGGVGRETPGDVPVDASREQMARNADLDLQEGVGPERPGAPRGRGRSQSRCLMPGSERAVTPFPEGSGNIPNSQQHPPSCPRPALPGSNLGATQPWRVLREVPG